MMVMMFFWEWRGEETKTKKKKVVSLRGQIPSQGRRSFTVADSVGKRDSIAILSQTAL
jgi:hypothetical protein